MRFGKAAPVLLLLASPLLLSAAENIRLNPRLNFQSNNFQGMLITGDKMTEGAVKGIPNYIVFYSEQCYNSKRQARTTVDLYRKYRGRIHFVVLDFNYGWSAAQEKLVRKYFGGNIPQIVILDKNGEAVFDYTGETPEWVLEGWLDSILRKSPATPPSLDAEARPSRSGN